MLVRLLLAPRDMGTSARTRVLCGVMSAGLATLALVPACGSADGPGTTKGGSAGNAGAGSQAGAASKGGSEGSQSGSSSGGDSQPSGGKGGASGGGTTSAGAGGGVGSPCRTDADCPVAIDLHCTPPGAAYGCGACPGPTTCSTDADCRAEGENKICEIPCGGVCPMGTCMPGCTEETVCPIGTVCGTAGRCQPSACTVREDCPPDFDCRNSGCFRRPCESDAECDGYCVLDACYSALGACVRPVG